ncbi:MAG: hypothetical protein HQL68_01470 [Magnetococcales bacterium]|nr:hypothetical protein [Magnetococcales bacterium]
MNTANKIERFFKNFGLFAFTICLLLAVLEVGSSLVLYLYGINPNKYEYNQILSGYHVFKNTPGAPLWNEVKKNPDDPPSIVDRNGFVSDNPIFEKKPDDVIRIFVMGGSAVFGVGQFPPFASVHPYHLGNLSYSLGLAGQLESYLSAQRPGLKFEVINAAATDRMLHQSMIYYQETISRFSPDIIINLDGYNDLHYGIMSGRPYAEMEARIPNYVTLLDEVRLYKPKFMTVLNLLYNRYFRNYVGEQLKKQFYLRDDMDQEKYSIAQYRKYEDSFTGSSQRFLQILDHYMAVLHSDKVDFIFAIQPMLYRQINKEWSKIENQMRREVFGVGPNLSNDAIDRFILMSKYFFDEYLSKASQERVEKSGFRFLDLNQEIRHLKSDFELYIDYCHFTVDGSRTVAEILGKEVLKRFPVDS